MFRSVTSMYSKSMRREEYGHRKGRELSALHPLRAGQADFFVVFRLNARDPSQLECAHKALEIRRTEPTVDGLLAQCRIREHQLAAIITVEFRYHCQQWLAAKPEHPVVPP